MLLQQIIILKLPSWHFPLKKNIQFLERPPPTLRNAKPTPNQANQTNSTKQESRLAAPIRFVAVQHIWHCDGKDDGSHGLDGGCDGNGAAAETGRGDLGDDDEADGADGHLVGEGPDVHEGCLGPDGTGVGAAEVEEADYEEDEGHEDHAGVVDCAAAEEGH